MGLKLHGATMSTCTQRVLVVAKELGLDVEIVPVNFAAKEHKSQAYLESKQPFGQVPVLEDDGFFLFESRAIGKYLVAKYGKGSTLVPTGIQENAIFEQACSIEVSNFDPYASGVAVEKIFKPMHGGQTDEAKYAEHVKTLEAKLQGYEIILKKQKFLGGNEITVADLFHLPYGTMATERLGVTALTSSSTPNVARWWKDVSERKSWQAVQAEAKAVL